MIHGPCGSLNPKCPCMKDGKCKYKYPRPLLNETRTDTNGYPLYRRRSSTNGGFTTKINIKIYNKYESIEVNNTWVVPYCPILSKIMKAHLNVELCSSVSAVKYILKYIHKGSDQTMFAIQNKDEIENYQNGRYVSSNEAIWRILGFQIHDRYPTVIHLSVHLENGQRVYYTSENIQTKVIIPPETTLTAFFKVCQIDNFAKTLLYTDIPKYYTWDSNLKRFTRRKQGMPVDGFLGIHSTNTLG